jgi:hypothetical protein
MPLPPSKLLLNQVAVSAGLSSDYAERGDGNSVVVEFVPSGASPSASFQVQDSGFPGAGYYNTADSNGATGTITAYAKRVVAGVLPFVKVLPTITAGTWTVIVTPINEPSIQTVNVPGNVNLSQVGGVSVAEGQAAMAASIPVVLASNQSAPAAAQRWPVQLSDGTNSGPAMDASARPGYQRTAYDVGVAGDLAVSGANAAATITYAAQPSLRHVITGVIWSYSGAPTGGRITITDGGVNVKDIDVTAGGPGQITFPEPLAIAVNSAMTIVIAAGGGTLVGKVQASGHRTEA